MILELQTEKHNNADLVMGLTEIIKETETKNQKAQRRIDELERKLEVANKKYTEEIEEALECKLCLEVRQENEFKVFNPCGHRACETCMSHNNFCKMHCPFCRTLVESHIPFFLSQ